MSSKFNYDLYLNKGLQEIRQVRAPHSKPINMDEPSWNEIKQQQIFDFGDTNFTKHANVLNKAKQISLMCLYKIIVDLSHIYKVDFEKINISLNPSETYDIYFILKDIKTDELLLFCDIIKDRMWKLSNEEEPNINQLIVGNNAKGCKYVFLMYDKAYLQLMHYNADEKDSARGTNFFALKWFFEYYFGKEEYVCFEHSLKKYVKQVGDYLGYSTIKSLTPSALINFKRITENGLIEFPYQTIKESVLKDKKGNNFFLNEKDYEKIFAQFITSKFYMVMLSEKDYAESLITAEWLNDSMNKAQAVDLTVIGMGYFKSVEQLLFELICLHANEKLLIKRNNSKETIELNDFNIKRGNIDSTIGSMANFYRYNLSILRNDLNLETKNYVKESIFKYAELRNGFFHKHNIHKWETIDEIRNATFNMFYLLLGSHQLTEENVKRLGKSDDVMFTDYYRLCEYMNYHSNEMFFVVSKEGNEGLFWSMNDTKTEVADKGYVSYSGVYLKEVAQTPRQYRITENSLPQVIWSAKLSFENSNIVKLTPYKVDKIFENGKFIGSNIAKDDEYNY